MKKISLLTTALFALLALLATVSVMAQTAAVAPAAVPQQAITTDAAPVQAAVPAQTAAPVGVARPAAPRQVYTYPYGYVRTQPQQQYYTNRGGRPVTFQEYFGFDGIPFNGSHIQAFRRYHGRGF